MILYDNVDMAYVSLSKMLLHASEIDSRNGMTKEIHPLSFVVGNFKNYFLNVQGRVINFPMALAELVWIMSGDDTDWIIKYNKQLENYADIREISIENEGEVVKEERFFNAAYGKRMRKQFGIDQIRDVVNAFAKDVFTRQAAIIYRHPVDDSSFVSAKDKACNIASLFLVRQGALDITQIVRSQDFIWGLPYNLIQFGYITQYIAELLGLEVGQYIETVNSLHVYEHHWQELPRIDIQPHVSYSVPAIGNVNMDFIRKKMILMEDKYENDEMESFDYDDIGKISSPFWHDAMVVFAAYWFKKANKNRKCAAFLLGCRSNLFVEMATKYFYYHYNSFRKDYSSGEIELFQVLKTKVGELND